MIDWLKMEDTDTFLYGIKRKSLILKFSLLNMYTAFIKSIFIITHTFISGLLKMITACTGGRQMCSWYQVLFDDMHTPGKLRFLMNGLEILSVSFKCLSWWPLFLIHLY